MRRSRRMMEMRKMWLLWGYQKKSQDFCSKRSLIRAAFLRSCKRHMNLKRGSWVMGLDNWILRIILILRYQRLKHLRLILSGSSRLINHLCRGLADKDAAEFVVYFCMITSIDQTGHCMPTSLLPSGITTLNIGPWSPLLSDVENLINSSTSSDSSRITLPIFFKKRLQANPLGIWWVSTPFISHVRRSSRLTLMWSISMAVSEQGTHFLADVIQHWEFSK